MRIPNNKTIEMLIEECKNGEFIPERCHVGRHSYINCEYMGEEVKEVEDINGKKYVRIYVKCKRGNRT